MWRSAYRMGLSAGLAVIVMIMAVAVLALPVARLRAAQSGGLETPPQAVSSAPGFTVVMSTVVPSGLMLPVGIANAADGSGRLFVLEQHGYVRIIKNGVLLLPPYLNIENRVLCCGEQGLLGVAFDPDFATNGTFYVNYTTNAQGFAGDTVVARYQVANPAADVANVIHVTHIITIEQPQANHNGGDLHFGPDGYLYIGMGDGGNSNDVGAGHAPEGNGQSPGTWLGKMLRIHVRNVPTYTIPPTNPFAQTAGYKPEIWSLGWRNPWRFSFDRATGDMYIGDVGQNCWEEISYEPASDPGGRNYGWRMEEGLRRFDPDDAFNCALPVSTLVTTTKPITAYLNDNVNTAVTGGYVYRGQQYPWMRGVYFYSDSGSGVIWAIQQVSPGVWSGAKLIDTPYAITAFGEDENGELYVTDYGQGGIYKITSSAPTDFSTSSKKVSKQQAAAGNMLTYTIVVRNSGGPFAQTVRVTDTVPGGLSYLAGSLKATSGTPDDSARPTLKWHGEMSTTPVVTLTYGVTVATSSPAWILNNAIINPGNTGTLTRTAAVLVNPRRMLLPAILRQY